MVSIYKKTNFVYSIIPILLGICKAIVMEWLGEILAAVLAYQTMTCNRAVMVGRRKILAVVLAYPDKD